MATFHYRALTRDGKSIAGDIDASGQAEAVDSLRSRGLLPIEAVLITETTGQFAKTHPQALQAQPESPGRKRRLIHQRRVTQMLREVGTLVHAAQTVELALKISIEHAETTTLRLALERTLNTIRGGLPLSEAMRNETGLFTPIDINLVRAGENTGRLGAALIEAAELREKKEALTRKIQSTLIYPSILLCTAVAAIAILLGIVVPEFSHLFEGREMLLPPATQFIFALSNSLSNLTLHDLAITVAVLLVALQLRRFGPVRNLLSAFYRNLPVFGPLIRKITTAELCRSLGTLRTGGVDLPQALALSAQGISDRAARSAIESVISGVRQGRMLSDMIAEKQIIETAAVRMIAAGEESGYLDTMLAKIAEIYEGQVESSLTRLVNILEPVLVLFLGLVAGGIVLSIMSAVISVNELVR